MAIPVAFIIGGGPRIGYSVGAKLRSEGYKVAVGSRNPDVKSAAEAEFLPVSVDVTDAQSVHEAFETVRQKLGVPGVVVYNAAALSFPSDMSDPFPSITPEIMQRDTSINALGGYAALREAVGGFKTISNAATSLPQGVFIATGNVTPFQPMPMALSLSVGKAALVHAIQLAIETYKSHGFRFYFPSQVGSNGGPVPHDQVAGEAHGRVYWDLVNRSSQGTWDVRFDGYGKEVE